MTEQLIRLTVGQLRSHPQNIRRFYDQAGLRDCMARVIEDTALREELSARSLARSKTFSWDACYAATVAAYRRAAKA